jgi:hypothetical protein
MNVANIKDIVILFLNKLKDEIVTLSVGRAKFSSMLYLWGLTPAIIIALLLQRNIDRINNMFLVFIIYIFISLYFSWHLFVIRKTLKVQPEYRRIKIKDTELFKDKSEKEINEIKKERRKSKIRKLLLLDGWNSMPPYVIIACLDVYVVLTQLQGMYNIFR